MKKLLSIISLACAAVWLTAIPSQAETPTAYVRSILDRAMAIQNDPALDTPGRKQAIRKLIEQSFDFSMMARDALGASYGGLGGGQRQEFTRVFSRLFQDSYTRLVLNFLKKENVEYKRESRQNGNVRVDTSLVRTNESIPVAYLLHRAPSGWILYDVIVDGVSILQNYRNQFGQVIKTKGFDFLLGKMREQLRALE